MYNRNEIAEQHIDKLTRSIDMSIVPIVRSDEYDLAVISTIAQSRPRDLQRYTRTLIEDFAHSGLRVQVLIADNTPAHTNRIYLDRMGSTIQKAGIDCALFHVPEPGKPHGLNACLEAVRAPVVESIDINKYPARGTLRGLYDDVIAGKADLVSSRILRLRALGQTPQSWCAGQAYAGKRWCFPGFPEVLNEDEYTHLLTLARGGSFAISDRILYDKTPPNSYEAARRIARTDAGSQQLHYTTVRDGDKQYCLGDVSLDRTKPQECELGSTAGTIYQLARAPLGYKLALGRRIVDKVAHISSADIAQTQTQMMQRLVENPKMCAW